MKIRKGFSILIMISFLPITSCGVYSFTGASIPPGTKTFQVDYFENVAGNRPGSIVEPGLDRDFTLALQDLLLNQTNLNLVKGGGDLIYSGQIIEYRVSPMSATSQNTASQNRLSIKVSVNYVNVKMEEDSFEQTFSFYYDFPADLQVFDIKDSAHKEIFERITQDIFNASLAKW
tara:strand:+ start:2325 stop:2849 length:525 start_codon:yes stop_codon:yes gene_type:complete